MSPKTLLIYLPPLLMVLVCVFLPVHGRDQIGRLNAREFLLPTAFWWIVLTVAIRVVLRMVRGPQRPVEQQGFEVLPPSGERVD